MDLEKEKNLNDKESSEEEIEEPEDSDEEEQKEEEEFKIEQIKEKDPAPNDMDQYITPQKKSGSKILTLVAIIIVVALAAGIYFLLNGQKETTLKPSEESNKTVLESTPEPTPTPEPLNRSEWFFEVLNGSGVSGEAKRVADQLKALGYTVTKTGNADKDTYTQSQIIIQKNLEERINLVIADIKDVIRIASVSATLSESTPSGRIIIGKE